MKNGLFSMFSSLIANTPPSEKRYSSRKFLSLFFILFLAVGNAWGAESVTVDLAIAKNSDPNPSIGEIIGTNYSKGNFDGNGYKIGSDNNSIGWNIASSGKTFTSVSFEGYINTSKTEKDWGFKFSTDGGTTWGAELTQANDGTKSYHSINVTVAIPEGANAIQIIRKAGTSTYVKSITLTLAPDAGGEPVCPETLTITSKDSKAAFLEGDAIELTAALSAGNGDISYQWYKGSVAPANAISGATNAKYQVASCTTADEGDYFCVASKTSCDDAVNASSFAITVAADTKCFNMPNITSKPANLAAVLVTGGTLADVGDGKTLKMQGTGIGFGNGNAARLKVTLTGASIVAGTKITIDYNNASTDGSGIGLYNGDYDHQVIATTGVKGDGSVSHTFTAEEAAYYADEFLIDRNNTGKGIIVGSITVEDCGPAVTKHTIILNYNDGETTNGSLTVVDGSAAAKPADPTRGKYTFLGWFVGDTDDEYVWSTAVTGDLTLKAHWQDPWTITFDADGGSAVSDITVKHNTKAEKPTDPTKDANDFLGWFYGDPAVEFDWDANVTQNYALVAHWQSAVAKYDVEYYDGETKIGTEEQVWATAHPTAAGIETAKPLYTFVGWFTSSALEGDPVDLNTVTPVEGLKLYGKWTKAFATSYDMEAYAVSDGASLATLLENLTAAGYAYTNVNGIDNGHTHNYIYDGMKYKTNDGDLSFNVNAGKLVIVKTGNLPANALTMYINGVADPTVFVGANEAVERHVNNYFYSADEALYRLDIQASKGTCAIKAVTITDPFTVTFNANGGDDIAAVQAKPSITLPEPTNGTMNFKGWYDAATEGNKIGDAGEEYTPTADVTIYAQWEALSTINTLSDLQVDGVTINGFSSDVHTYNIVVPYGTDVANLPKITSATATNANASVAIWPAAPAWTNDFGGCYRQQVVVTPQDPNAAVGYNDIRITIAPKDGVSIIKVATTGGTNKTVTGLYAGDGDVNLSSNMKMDDGKYIGFTLAGTTLQAGDRINVHTTTASNSGGSHIIFYDNMTDKTELYETGEIGVVGDNIFTINAAMVGSASAYVYRANTDNAHKWNGYIDFIEVLRPMNPVLTAITFDGNAAEMGVGNTFSVTLQNGTDLNAMTVVPTIVKNGEGGSATPLVAWAWGENTYRVTDKDGDYTDYTITLTEAASPSAAPVITTQPADGNYIEGETITALKVVATGSGELSYQWYLGAEAIDGATAATYTPTVSAIGSYVYHCVVTNTEAGHPATSLVSSDATITIAEDPAAIKLLNDAGAINTTDFITGVSATTVNFNDAVHNCATFGSTASTVVGASGLNKYIIYNSKTTQTKIKFVLYNVQNASVTMKLQKLVEGGTEMEEVVINVPSKEVFTTDFYTFDGSANRTMYAFVQNTGIKVLQVKVIDNGTPLKQFGEVGYSINFNKGRLFLASGNEIAYDGLTYNASSNYAPLNNEGLSLASSKSYRFEVPADVTMTVTAANNKKYYITDKEDGSDNETAAAEARSFDLTAGAWYLRVDGSNLGLTKIEFTAPICNLAITTQPESNTNFGAGDMTATVVAASSTDGATLAYQWYNVSDDSEVSGANTETLTTTTPGEYYVVITSSKTGYQDKVIKSNTIELGYRDLTIATLGALSQGGNAITLEDGVYEYNVYLVEGTTVVPALAATATQAPYGATAVPTNAAAFDNYEAVSTVLVTAEDGTTTQTYTVHFYVAHEILALVDVTGNMTWDFSKANDGTAAEKGLCNEVIFANVDGINNNDDFESDNLMVTANKFSNGKLQASMIKFHTTVDGVVKVMFSHTGNDKVDGRALVVNGTYQSALSYNQTVVMYSCFVPAGDVILTVTTGDGGSMLNFTNVDFKAKVTPDYTRNQMLGNGVLGTICLPFNVPSGAAFGATFYELQGREPQYGKLVFDEIVSGELEAGKPYVFQAHGDVINIFYGDTQVSEPVNTGNGMYGTFTDITLTELADVYYFAQRALWSCTDLTSLSIPANRAYVKLSEIAYLTPAQQNPAPGVRRITMAVNGQNTTTGFENIDVTDKPVKMIIDGQLYIIRGEKAYDAQGKLVK